MLKTVMTNSNLLSDTYRMGLYPRTHRQLKKSCDKRASISSVIITFYITIAYRETSCHSVGGPKTLQTQLLHWCHDHFISDHLSLNKTYERPRSAYFWNNMFADLQRWIKSCGSCAQKKRDVHHCCFWSMGSYCCRLSGIFLPRT